MENKNYLLVKEEYYLPDKYQDNDALTRYFLVSASPSNTFDYLINEVFKYTTLVPWVFSDDKRVIDRKTIKDLDLVNYIKDTYPNDFRIQSLLNFIINNFDPSNLSGLTLRVNQLTHLFSMPYKGVKYFNDLTKLNTFIKNNRINSKDIIYKTIGE